MAETLDVASGMTEGYSDTDMKSPSSPSSSSSDDEGAERSKLVELEKELEANPSNYESHVQYIQALRRNGDVEKLRGAREAMNAMFPLSPSMWQEWASDEASLQSGSEAFTFIEGLYNRAVDEYLSVPVWCDYINFVEEHDKSVSKCSPEGISKMRDLFERAVTAAGLHITEGHKIWEAYREFEQAIFLTIEDDKEEKAKQVLRIRRLFHRQLSLPHSEFKATLIAYKMWEAEQGAALEISPDNLDGIPPDVVSVFRKAVEKYNARIAYEDKISKSDISETERLHQFVTYIKFEESSGDPAHVQNLYERAVTNFPVSSDLWIHYTCYIDLTLKIASLVKSVYSRAIRNCSWVGELWSRYLLSLERVSATEDELCKVFERSLQCIFSTIEEYLDLFLTRIDSLRRRITSEKGLTENSGLKFELIRETFERASDYLSPHAKNTENFLRLHAYWSRLEMTLAKDLTATREVWERFTKSSGLVEGWFSYIAMEIELGHINEARSIYRRCYSRRFPGTGSEDVCHAWLRFEREFGTLEDFDLAEKKVRPRLKELQSYESQQEPQMAVGAAALDKFTPQKHASQKRKSETQSYDEEHPSKRKKDFRKQKDDGNRRNKLKEAKESTSNHTSEDAPPIAQNLAEHEPANEQAGVKSANDMKPSFYTDKCTAFISNLSPQANDSHLREFFKDIGGVSDIRLLKDKFTGKSRGLAYIDFSDEEHLAAAVAKNRQKLLGQRLSVARSNPKQSQKRSSAGGSAMRGRGRDLSSDEHSKVADAIESPTRSSTFVSHRRGGHLQLKGSNTFAMPRSVARPLGWSKKDPVKDPDGDDESEKPKSNEEFRKLLTKS